MYFGIKIKYKRKQLLLIIILYMFEWACSLSDCFMNQTWKLFI